MTLSQASWKPSPSEPKGKAPSGWISRCSTPVEDPERVQSVPPALPVAAATPFSWTKAPTPPAQSSEVQEPDLPPETISRHAFLSANGHPYPVARNLQPLSSRERNLKAESSGIVPVVIMQMTNGEWQNGRAGSAMSRICAKTDFKQRTMWTLTSSPMRTESGGPVKQLEMISMGLK